MKCEGKQFELGTSIFNKDPKPRKTNISIMCVLPFVNLSSESLHICIPFKIPTEVRKFKRNHGEELSKEERSIVFPLLKGESGKQGLMSWGYRAG